MSTVTLSTPHWAITSAENPDGIASQAFTTALPEAQTFFTLFATLFPSLVFRLLSPPRYRQARAPRFWRAPCAFSAFAGCSGTCFGVTAEIGGGDGFVAPEFLGLAAEHDAAGFQNVAVIRHRKPHARVLLDQQHRGVLPDLRDDPEHRLHDDGRKPQRRLVEQQQPRLVHQPARERDPP